MLSERLKAADDTSSTLFYSAAFLQERNRICERARFMGMTFASGSAFRPLGLRAADLNQSNVELCCVILLRLR